MDPTESSSVTVFYRGLGSQHQAEAVVWLGGEHDSSTVATLTETLAQVIAIDDADLVLDLSGVRFMSAATIEVLIRARDFLRMRSRSLSLRSPQDCVSRALALCGLADLVEPGPAEATHMAGPAGALGTWVAVPARERADRAADEPELQPMSSRESGVGLVTIPTEVSLDADGHGQRGTTRVAGRGGP